MLQKRRSKQTYQNHLREFYLLFPFLKQQSDTIYAVITIQSSSKNPNLLTGGVNIQELYLQGCWLRWGPHLKKKKWNRPRCHRTLLKWTTPLSGLGICCDFLMSPNNSFKFSRNKDLKISLLFLGFLPKHLHCFQPSTEGDKLYFKHCRSKIPKLISLFGHNGALTDQLPCMKGRCFTEKRSTALFFNLPAAEDRSLRWYPAMALTSCEVSSRDTQTSASMTGQLLSSLW